MATKRKMQATPSQLCFKTASQLCFKTVQNGCDTEYKLSERRLHWHLQCRHRQTDSATSCADCQAQAALKPGRNCCEELQPCPEFAFAFASASASAVDIKSSQRMAPCKAPHVAARESAAGARGRGGGRGVGGGGIELAKSCTPEAEVWRRGKT
jgi:hypothetical protein